MEMSGRFLEGALPPAIRATELAPANAEAWAHLGILNYLRARKQPTPQLQAKAQEQAQAEADQEAVEAALSAYEEKVAQIESADLLPVQVESLRALARKGVDVSEEIEKAKAVLTAVKESVANDGAAPGRIVESGTPEDYTLRGYEEAK